MQTADLRDPFRALADPTRREILAVLRRGPRPAQELAARFPQMSRPAVSKHLRILRQAGLATETRDGRRRIYRLQTHALESVSRWLAEMEGAVETATAEAPAPPERRRGVKRERSRARRRPTGGRRRSAKPAVEAGQTGPQATERVEEGPAESPRGAPLDTPPEGLDREAIESSGGDHAADWKSW